MIAKLVGQVGFEASAAKQSADAQRHGIAPSLQSHGRKSGFLEFADTADGRRRSIPVRGFLLEPPTPWRRERIELRAAIVHSGPPRGLDPARLFQLVKGGIQRAIAALELLFRNLPQALADRPAVHRLEREDLQDQEIESALDEVGRLAHFSLAAGRWFHWRAGPGGAPLRYPGRLL